MGQLPGDKVTAQIAAALLRARRDPDPPPPHHDIYSIEDLAQLIFDIKQINLNCLVSVKSAGLRARRRRHHRLRRG